METAGLGCAQRPPCARPSAWMFCRSWKPVASVEVNHIMLWGAIWDWREVWRESTHARSLTHSLQLGAQCCRRPGSQRRRTLLAGGLLAPGTASARSGPASPAPPRRPPKLPGARARPPARPGSRRSGCHAACRREERGSRRTKSQRGEEPSSGPRLQQGLSGRWSPFGAAPPASRGPDTRAGPEGLGLPDTPPGPGSRLPPLPTPTQRPERLVLAPDPCARQRRPPWGHHDSAELVLLLRDPMGQVLLHLPAAPALLPPQPGKSPPPLLGPVCPNPHPHP